EQLRVSEHLTSPGLDDAGAGNERIAGRRRQAVDRDVRRQDEAAQREGGEAAGGVDHAADHRGVEEAGVLAEIAAPRQLQLGTTGARGARLYIAPSGDTR